MSRKDGQIIVGVTPLKEASTEAVITLGAESAAKLGVPVGSKVDLGLIAYHHRFPPVSLLAHGKTGRRQWRNEFGKWHNRHKIVNHAGFDLSTPAGITAARAAVVV